MVFFRVTNFRATQFDGSSNDYLPTMPRLRLLHVPGRREVDNNFEISTETVKFFDKDDLNGADEPKSCEDNTLCVEEKVFHRMGVEGGEQQNSE